MKFYLNNVCDPAFNLALEELLSRGCGEGSAFMLWRNGPSVIVGRNQDAASEVDLAAAAARGIPVVRRETGGGAVYHDLGNINYTFVSPRGMRRSDFRELARPVAAVLRGLGLAAEFSGRNDLVIENCKVSGCAGRLLRDRVMFHGTLLFDADLNVLAELLTPDPRKLAARGVRSVRSRVANLREFLPELSPDDFMERMRDGLIEYFGLSGVDEIPSEMRLAASELADGKYRTAAWNIGEARRRRGLRRSGRFPGGSVEVTLDIRAGHIAGVRFSGDFFGDVPVVELESKLRGLRCERNEIECVLAGIELDAYMRGVDASGLAGLIAGE